MKIIFEQKYTMSKSGFFCDQCLNTEQMDLFIEKTSKCQICLVCDEKLNTSYEALLEEEEPVCEALMKTDDGETCIILGFFQEAYFEYEIDDDNAATSSGCCANHKEVEVTHNFNGMRKTKTFLNRLDFNLNVWKSPVLEGLTRDLCQPLAVLAKSNVITVTVAKVILLMIGSCLRDKTEVIKLFDSVVYDRSPEISIKY
jgi:hypothetical protein